MFRVLRAHRCAAAVPKFVANGGSGARGAIRGFASKAAKPAPTRTDPVYPIGGLVGVGAVGYTIYTCGNFDKPPEQSVSAQIAQKMALGQTLEEASADEGE
eukprot:SAG31_NODE_20557_length_571_cov_0.841102_1_plen_100_part_01